MATDWNALTAEEDRAYFMAELVEISPQSFTLEEKQRILRNMIEASAAIENAMRDDFARLDEVAQTRLIDALAEAGPRDRDWWYRTLVAGPRHREEHNNLDRAAPHPKRYRAAPYPKQGARGFPSISTPYTLPANPPAHEALKSHASGLTYRQSRISFTRACTASYSDPRRDLRSSPLPYSPRMTARARASMSASPGPPSEPPAPRISLTLACTAS